MIALFAAIGGSATAAFVVKSKDIKNGTIVAKDIHNRTLGLNKLSKSAIKRLSGAKGPAGAPGPAGAAATKLFVQVDGTATPPTATRASGVARVDGPAQTGQVGLFEVTFGGDISRCVPLASGSSRDTNFPGIEMVTANIHSANSVWVQTADNTGAAANRFFSLAVFC